MCNYSLRLAEILLFERPLLPLAGRFARSIPEAVSVRFVLAGREHVDRRGFVANGSRVLACRR